MAKLPPSATVHHSESALQHYAAVAEELEAKEKALHLNLHSDVEKVVADKKILLFSRMFEDIDYDDLGVVNYLIQGVKVVGNLETVGIWKPQDRRAACSVQAVWEGSKQAQIKMLEARRPIDVDTEVWAKTMEEVDE
eukprot:168764-Karenia_brevis.AAC.1